MRDIQNDGLKQTTIIGDNTEKKNSCIRKNEY